MTKIVIDTKGGDRGAEAMVCGAALALREFAELSVLLVGDEEYLATQCEARNLPSERVEILDAPAHISNFDDPSDALFHKRDSSMLTALRVLGEREDLTGLLSAGNTGVLLTGAMRYLPLAQRVRPALAAVLPAQDGSFTCLVDTGATIDCTAPMLQHFAHLGSELMRDMYALERPRVGLLSNGAESSKGNHLVKETYPLLAADEKLHFVGNIEGNVALSGACDVLVCDGFAGNQVLKVTEGTAARMIGDIVRYAKREKNESVMALAAHLMQVYDIGSLGGGYILGISKPVIKLRGNAGERAVVNTCRMLLNMAQNRAMFDREKNKL